MRKSLLNTEIESGPKAKLMAVLRSAKRGVPIRHENTAVSGIPDISYTDSQLTTWWEIKLAKPNFDSTGLQELTMLRLAAWGYARYIVFGMDPLCVAVVHPKHIKEWYDKAERLIPGWNYGEVVRFILKVHGNDFAV